MFSKVKSTTMEIPENIIELQNKYANTLVKILAKKLSPTQLDELIENIDKNTQNNFSKKQQ